MHCSSGNSFIHSFITKFYIAPLQGYYSGALPTPVWLKGQFSGKYRKIQSGFWDASAASRGRGQPLRRPNSA